MPARSTLPRTPTSAEVHSEWLGLLRPDGPFLALTVLTDVFDGLDSVPKETLARVRQAWTEVSQSPDLLTYEWQQLIIDEVLRYPASTIMEEDGARRAAVRGRDSIRMHLYRYAFNESLTTAVKGEPSLAERAGQRCRDERVPLALLTNGQFWVLVHAKPGGPTSTAVFDADLWLEEPLLLRAFATLLSQSRVLAAGDHSLAGLFELTAAAQAKVTTTLGNQVRQAVELFVAELARHDRESGGDLLAGVAERDIYRASMTVLMRLVFLLYAEEQRLLPVLDPIYARGYAVSTVYDQLDEERNRRGEEILDRRVAAWPRLIALFTAIHGGCDHPDMRVPAHGGSLFDPLPYPWLTDARVTDRVVMEILEALLVLRHPGRAAERLSYQGLSVEQIGHVYEGLLEFSCLRVDEPYVGLIGKLEPELPLAELTSLSEEDVRARTGLTANQFAKAMGRQPSREDEQGALDAACDNDHELAEQVRPFWGLLRHDLRGQPMVFPAGSVLFTQVGDRRATGTHYTPQELAEEVVTHTLAPLCYSPGPAEGAESGEWRTRSADELLTLKVVDPAMGSGAFLVSACRYLSDRVVEAWVRDGVPDEVSALLDSADDREGLVLAALRRVAARCVYGVDRDDMAVELAKLSLWLITLAKDKPFSFLDHALRCGDSLVGLVSEEQVKAFHLDPRKGWLIGHHLFADLNLRIEGALAEVVDLREQIESSDVQNANEVADKAALLSRSEQLVSSLRLLADAAVGAALSTSVKQAEWYEDDDDEETAEDRLHAIVDDAIAVLAHEYSPAERDLRELVDNWLRGPRPQPVRPFHWALEFPEVMRRGGFDAVVGNPPFIGGQRLTGSIGKDVREYLVRWLAKGKRGSADLCSYFLLRNLDVVHSGRVGIIATNTIAQGDTREVGLDQATANGWDIYRAVKSQPWPGTASLEVSLLWIGHPRSDEARRLDGQPVAGITPSLDSKSRVAGSPKRLMANGSMAFQGSNILGLGFTMSPEDAYELISKNSRNADVLFPYLNGKNLNSSSTISAHRWVINFRDWSIDVARRYPDCFALVEKYVKPERERNTYSKTAKERWWQYERARVELYEAIDGLRRVLVMAQTSSTQMPVFVQSGQVYDQKIVVFPTDCAADLSFRASAFQYWWTARKSSTMKSDTVYAPSDCCETLPVPEFSGLMDRSGEELDSFRREVMLERQLGLTKLYNLVHDESVRDPDIVRLREIHTEIDNAVAEAYGWDFDLGHGFHDTRQGRRWTIAPDVQVEVLDLLLELNHERHREEVAKGLVGKKKRAKSKKGKVAAPALDGALFPHPEGLF